MYHDFCPLFLLCLLLLPFTILIFVFPFLFSIHLCIDTFFYSFIIRVLIFILWWPLEYFFVL